MDFRDGWSWVAVGVGVSTVSRCYCDQTGTETDSLDEYGPGSRSAFTVRTVYQQAMPPAASVCMQLVPIIVLPPSRCQPRAPFQTHRS